MFSSEEASLVGKNGNMCQQLLHIIL